MKTEGFISETDRVFRELTNLLSSLSDEQFNQVPFEGSWTAGQLAQHIIMSAGGFLEMMNGPVKDTDREPDAHVLQIRTDFLDFSIKFKSPDFIDPELKHYDTLEMTRMLDAIRQGLLHAMATLDMSKTCSMFELPQVGYLTRFESAAFTLFHTQRHLHQLQNICRSIAGVKVDFSSNIHNN